MLGSHRNGRGALLDLGYAFYCGRACLEAKVIDRCYQALRRYSALHVADLGRLLLKTDDNLPDTFERF